MRFATLAKLAVPAFAAAFLGSCTVVEEPGLPPGPPPSGPPQACTQQYDPVCAARGGDRRTFGNACMARAEGYRIIRRGECRPQSSPPGGGQQACTMEYRPVCAVRGGDRRTFGNACQAETSGYRVVERGEC